MTVKTAHDCSCASGIVEHAESVRVIVHIKLAGRPVHGIARWLGPGQKWPLFPMKWIPVRLAYISNPPCLFSLATDGTIGFGYGSYAEEQIDTTNEGPLGRGPMRDLRVIGSTLFATGMARQVYRRVGPNHWARHDEGVVAPLGQLEVSGFNSIDGWSEQELWAAGFAGEIWHCVDGKWSREKSGTDKVLHRIRAASKQHIFACGQQGLILKRGARTWSEFAVVEQKPDLWGLEWFNGHMFVASSTSLYRIADAGVEKVNVPKVATFGHLHANDGVLWSFGERDLAWTRDGTSWTRVPPLEQ
jgi:hypothetical protein